MSKTIRIRKTPATLDETTKKTPHTTTIVESKKTPHTTTFVESKKTTHMPTIVESKKTPRADIKKTAHEMYMALNNPDVSVVSRFTAFETLVCKYTRIDTLSEAIDKMIALDNTSINALLIYYATNMGNTALLTAIIKKNTLMKRDYLAISKYFMQNNQPKLATHYFDMVIESKELLDKDIEFLIQNNMLPQLRKLAGMYYKWAVELYSVLPPLDMILKRVKFSPEVIKETIQAISTKITKSEYAKYQSFLDKHTKPPFDIIIDGCNVIHSHGGVVNRHSAIILDNIMKQVQSRYKNPLIIIHTRHTQNNPDLMRVVSKYTHYITPYRHNDDLFILLAFLKGAGETVHIVSNDKYRDHIFAYKTATPNIQQFKHILTENTIGYTISFDDKVKLETALPYSVCIQWIPEYGLFIPTLTGFYLIPKERFD